MTKHIQLGDHDRCARDGCASTPTYRVILGHFVVQVLVCTRHLSWGVELDSLSQDTGEAMGWSHGYPVAGMDERNYREIRTAQVTQTLFKVTRLSVDYYRRDESQRVSVVQSF